MRTIKRTHAFKKDYKRERRGRYAITLDDDLISLVSALAADRSLEPRHRDHALTGNWANYRDCHVRPDLVLIYLKPDPETLYLVRLGSHSELGL